MAKTDPVVASLLRAGQSIRDVSKERDAVKAIEREIVEKRKQITDERDAVKAAEREIVEKRKQITAVYTECAEETREAIFNAVEAGFSTPKIAEILGLNEAWVQRQRTSGRVDYRGVSTGPKSMVDGEGSTYTTKKPKRKGS